MNIMIMNWMRNMRNYAEQATPGRNIFFEETHIFPYPDWPDSGETYQKKLIFNNLIRLRNLPIYDGLSDFEFYDSPKPKFNFKLNWVFEKTSGSRKIHGGQARKDKGGWYHRNEIADYREEFVNEICLDFCPVSGKRLDYTLGYNNLSNVLGAEQYSELNFGRPSIDRIDNEKGYDYSPRDPEYSNVQILETRENSIKGCY